MAMKRPMRPPYRVMLVGDGYIKKREVDFKGAITEAFKNSKFSHGMSLDSVIRSSLQNTDPVLNEIRKTKNIVVLDQKGKILGATFNVPVKRLKRWDEGTVGWLFTSPELHPIQRIRIADKMANKMHKVMRKAGYKRLVAYIGTQEGEKFLQKRHGYYESVSNYTGLKHWVKDL